MQKVLLYEAFLYKIYAKVLEIESLMPELKVGNRRIANEGNEKSLVSPSFRQSAKLEATKDEKEAADGGLGGNGKQANPAKSNAMSTMENESSPHNILKRPNTNLKEKHEKGEGLPDWGSKKTLETLLKIFMSQKSYLKHTKEASDEIEAHIDNQLPKKTKEVLKKEAKDQKKYIKDQERELYDIWKNLNDKDFEFDFTKVDRLDLSN
jgi:hypothetical protein